MPGLVGLARASGAPDDSLPRMVEALLHYPDYQCVKRTFPLGGLAVVHHGLFDHHLAAKATDGSVGLMLDGWIYEVSGRSKAHQDAAELCLEAYLQDGVSFVERLNGEFNIAIWDLREQTVIVLNDRYGLRPLCYSSVGEALFFAPEAKAIFAGSSRAPELNRDMVLTYLSIGRAFPGDDTFFSGVDVLPPASILIWKDGEHQIDSYWDYRFRPLSAVEDDFVEELVAAFRRGVSRRLGPGRRCAVALSGGLDSRVVAGAVGESDPGSVSAFSFGIRESDEVRLAKEVAGALEMPWRCIDLAPGDFLENASEGVWITEGLDLFVQSYGMKVFPRIREDADLCFTGLALDLTLGGTYLDPTLLDQGSGEEAVLASLERRLRYFPEEMVGRLFKSDDAAVRASDLLRVAWQPLEGQSLADSTDRFALRYRVQRVIFQRQYWQRLFIEDSSPTFDNDFVDLVLQIPVAERSGHRTYHRFMSKLCPDLMEIPYQRTRLPATVPVEFWGRSMELERERERLCEAIWSATGGKVTIPYTRYATNYTQWMRSDPAWLEWTGKLIDAEDCRLPEFGLRHRYIKELFAEHRSGARDHRQRLLQILTLEVFLRRFFT